MFPCKSLKCLRKRKAVAIVEHMTDFLKQYEATVVRCNVCFEDMFCLHPRRHHSSADAASFKYDYNTNNNTNNNN